MRRGGRVAEGGGLLNRYTGLTRIVSSNLISSAKILVIFDITFSQPTPILPPFFASWHTGGTLLFKKLHQTSTNQNNQKQNTSVP